MSPCECGHEAAALERTTLRTLIAINGAMFVAEALAGWRAQSTGLLADSLDMLADAGVYGHRAVRGRARAGAAGPGRHAQRRPADPARRRRPARRRAPVRGGQRAGEPGDDAGRPGGARGQRDVPRARLEAPGGRRAHAGLLHLLRQRRDREPRGRPGGRPRAARPLAAAGPRHPARPSRSSSCAAASASWAKRGRRGRGTGCSLRTREPSSPRKRGAMTTEYPMKPIGFVRSPYRDAGEIPKGCGAPARGRRRPRAPARVRAGPDRHRGLLAPVRALGLRPGGGLRADGHAADRRDPARHLHDAGAAASRTRSGSRS